MSKKNVLYVQLKYLLKPMYLMRIIGHPRQSSVVQGSGLPLCSSAGVATRLHLSHGVSRPAVSASPSLPLPVRIPGQRLACDAGCWLPERVSHSASLPPSDLLVDWLLSCPPSLLFVADLLRSSDVADAPEAGAEERQDLLRCCRVVILQVSAPYSNTA